jgi:hypothetical protein
MLHAISLEHLQAPIVQQHRNVHDNFARRRTQHLLHALVQTQPTGGLVEAGFGRQARIEFVPGGMRWGRRRRGRFQKHWRLLRPYYRFRLDRLRVRRAGYNTR